MASGPLAATPPKKRQLRANQRNSPLTVASAHHYRIDVLRDGDGDLKCGEDEVGEEERVPSTEEFRGRPPAALSSAQALAAASDAHERTNCITQNEQRSTERRCDRADAELCSDRTRCAREDGGCKGDYKRRDAE